MKFIWISNSARAGAVEFGQQNFVADFKGEILRLVQPVEGVHH